MTEPLIPLKPCPFCGSKDVHLTELHSSQHVSCFACGAEGPFDLGNSGACAGWNTRPVEEKLLEALYYIANEDVDPWITQICAHTIAAAEGAP